MAISVKDVARRAGVSVGTVSNVLNGRASVHDELVERVHLAVAELGFVRNDAARQLRVGVSRAIGMIVLDASNPFFSGVARGAEDAAARDERLVLVGNAGESPLRESAYLAMFEQQRVAGVLVSPADADHSRLQELVARGTPVVLVDARSDEGAFPSVSVDDVEGGRLAAAHLIAEGRRRLAFVGGPMRLRQVSERLEGVRREVAGSAAALEVIEAPGMQAGQARAIAAALLSRPRRDLPDAVVAANDLVALAILQAAAARGITVPDDLAVVGYDDIPLAQTAPIPLTSVRRPAEELGQRAVELLGAALGEGPVDVLAVTFAPQLVVRASSRTAPGAGC